MLKPMFLCGLLPLLSHAEDVSLKLSLPEMPAPALGPDSQVKPGVAKGTVTDFVWKDSKVFPGTIRAYSVYEPAVYDPSIPTAVMVFQDGHNYLKADGEFRVPVVLDNLIAAGEIPPIIAFSSTRVTRRTHCQRNHGRRTTGAWNTTVYPMPTPDSCWRRSCRRSARP